jgi:hypothetical protein
MKRETSQAEHLQTEKARVEESRRKIELADGNYYKHPR